MNKHDRERGPVSRREFLSAGAAVGGAVVGSALLTGRDAASQARMNRITRFGFTTYQWGSGWDIPTLIENCKTAKVYGVELRTSSKYAHGVEIDIGAEKRREAKKRFADSPITLVGLASGERFDSPDPARLKSAIEDAKAHLRLSHDIGGSGVRVFPNDYQKNVAREKTIAQIAGALNELGAFARDYGQQVRFEAHGSAGDLPSIRAIMERVTQKSVRVKLNSLARDVEGVGFEANFNLVKPYLGDTLHLHELDKPDFPYQLQMDLLVKMGWTGWQLLEASEKVPDRLQALIAQREIWDRLLARSRGGA